MTRTPAVGSRWQHRNGNRYRVLALANTDSDNHEKYPPTVVYQGPNGKVWSRRLSDWERSFTALPPATEPSLTDMQDAYVGAREDLAIWKRRALEAERDLRAERETASRLAAEINATNGPTRMGEPATAFSSETQDQIAAVMLQHGTEGQQRAALAYASGQAPAIPRMSADEVNGLPDAARAYIHALVANADPAGMVRENMQLRDTNAALQAAYRRMADALKAATANSQPAPLREGEWINDAGRIKWLLWRVQDLEAKLAARAPADSVTAPADGANWQDISTAPKDGTRFVAVGNNYGLYSETQHTCIAQWFRGCWMEVSDWNEASELKYLTHWMPLPPLLGSAASAPADSVLEDAASAGFFLLLPQRPKPEAPAGTVGLDWDAYSGAQMLAYGRDCSNAAIAATQKQGGAT